MRGLPVGVSSVRCLSFWVSSGESFLPTGSSGAWDLGLDSGARGKTLKPRPSLARLSPGQRRRPPLGRGSPVVLVVLVGLPGALWEVESSLVVQPRSGLCTATLLSQPLAGLALLYTGQSEFVIAAVQKCYSASRPFNKCLLKLYCVHSATHWGIQ